MINIYKVVFRLSSWVQTAKEECFVVTDSILRVPDIVKDNMKPGSGESVIILGICVENDSTTTYLDEEIRK